MVSFLYYLLVASIVIPLLAVVKKTDRIYQYPFFMTSVMAIFILPQAYSLIRFPGGVNLPEIEDVILLCSMAIWGCFIGYMIKPSYLVNIFAASQINTERLLHVGAFFSVVGIVAGNSLPLDRVQFGASGGLTGILTIYLFFAQLSLLGFAICLHCFLKQFTLVRLFWLLFSGYSPAMSVMLGRRESAAVFVLTIALSLFFQKGKAPNRILLFGALAFAMLAIPATGTYRSLLSQGQLSRAHEIPLIENFKEFISKDSILELRNGAAVIKATRMQDGYQYGAGYWNQLVHRYVPAQLIGTSFKESLLIGENLDSLYSTQLASNYDIPVGATVTGIGDSYEQFGWLGFIFFAAVGSFFRSVWFAATNLRNSLAQIFYIMVCSSAMRSITHQTVDFLPGVLYQIIFLSIAFIYAAEHHSKLHTHSRAMPAMRNAKSHIKKDLMK